MIREFFKRLWEWPCKDKLKTNAINIENLHFVCESRRDMVNELLKKVDVLEQTVQADAVHKHCLAEENRTLRAKLGPQAAQQKLEKDLDDHDGAAMRPSPFKQEYKLPVTENQPKPTTERIVKPWKQWELDMIKGAVNSSHSTATVEYILARGSRTRHSLVSKIRRMGYRVKYGRILSKEV